MGVGELVLSRTSPHITCSCNDNFMACNECTFTKQTVVYLFAEGLYLFADGL